MSDEAADTAVHLLDGISQEQWNYWHNHPCSLLLRKYLKDYAESMKIAVVQRWQAGTLDPQTENEWRGKVIQLHEIEILSFKDVHEFYDVPKEQT